MQCASAATPIWSICGHSQAVAHLRCHSLVTQGMQVGNEDGGHLYSACFTPDVEGQLLFCDMFLDVLIRWVLDTGLDKLGSLGSFQKVEILTTPLKNAL